MKQNVSQGSFQMLTRSPVTQWLSKVLTKMRHPRSRSPQFKSFSRRKPCSHQQCRNARGISPSQSVSGRLSVSPSLLVGDYQCPRLTPPWPQWVINICNSHHSPPPLTQALIKCLPGLYFWTVENYSDWENVSVHALTRQNTAVNSSPPQRTAIVQESSYKIVLLTCV